VPEQSQIDSPYSGFLGLARRDAEIGWNPDKLHEFIARFKHALLFQPKLILAEDMPLSPNFKEACRQDPAFKELFCDSLVEIAYFERFKDGSPMTLVQKRKFNDFHQHADKNELYDPRNPACPRDPFDSTLETIESAVTKRFPDGPRRDPLFTSFADDAVRNGALKPALGKVYSCYETAYWNLREEYKTLGIIHFDERFHKFSHETLPQGYRRKKPVQRPKLGPWLGVIDQILLDDQSQPRKQRHTAKRVWDRLKSEHGFDGCYTVVKDYVRQSRLQHKEVFVPLAHPPGEAQADFGEALVVIGGVEQKAHFQCMDLPHSDDCFVVAFPAENTEAFLEGHNQAFAYFGGVPRGVGR
jgi:hypothetical protein